MDLAASLQGLSGLGVILVGSCGPLEILEVHYIAAAFGFGGSALAQMLYNVICYSFDEEGMPASARRILCVRVSLSSLFLGCAFSLGVSQSHPWDYIFEWSLWFNLIAWYYTFKWDLADYYVGSIDQRGGRGGGEFEVSEIVRDDGDAREPNIVHLGVPLL